MKILLVEDEKQLAHIIKNGLKKMSYAIDTAFDGEEALELLEINSYDLVILDLNLPKIDGIDVLKRIRETDDELKVLILSARNDVVDKVHGLDLGANDYLEKPFDFLELAARIRNLLRRSFIQTDTTISCGRLHIDTAAKIVTIDNELLDLTNKEYGILQYLALNKDRFVSAEEMIEHVWESDIDPFSNSFKVHMHSLRKKVGVKGMIKNVRGKGYQLNHGTTNE
ncbi:response regulator transcription factor [Bacillaceae bacterium SIJ1]|uniref:response regulator transcription factor n=1 Tax=Litoribacterium kuwaitense TaxID=1398745 RepID=UPI0013EDF9D3|nr:response regulator transcription factor [Litoribacterium kuwaitense]NGP45656.1 response regulator transcription factor [Litoribacterium kuwaitense]